MPRGRPAKVLNKKEIELIVDEKIRALLGELKIESSIKIKGKRGRPVGYSPKKKRQKKVKS